MASTSTQNQGGATVTVKSRTAAESVGRAADIALRYKLDAAAGHTRALLDARFRTGTVVVLGEIKRGKSSLVNALVGHRALLPVDVLTCTSAPIRVIAVGQTPAATVQIRLIRGDQRELIPAAELAKWVTQESVADIERTGSEEEIAALPTAAEIEVPFPELAGVTIVDTPGVGGLDEHAVHAALQEARQAGLLLMVCDASSPITAPEMDILRRARESAGGVVVAVTKTDKNTRRWRSIVADDARLIEKHLGVAVPVIGISSLRAIDAAESADPARRAELEERSGIAELRRVILAHVNRPRDQGVHAALEAARAMMTRILADITADIRINEGASAAVAELEVERTRLEQLREESSEWEQIFGRDVQVARNRITVGLDRDLDQLREDWTKRIGKEGLKVLRSKPQVFTSQIEVDLQLVMERSVAELMTEVEKQSGALFPDNPELRGEINAAVLDSIAPTDTASREVASKIKDILDPSVMMMGVMGAGVLTAIIPIAPLAGAAWIGVNMGYRAMRNGKQHLLTWLRETTMTTRSTTTRMLDTVIATARTEILLRHRSLLRRRIRELQAKIDEARQAAKDSESERRTKVTRLKRNEEIITAMVKELDAHLSRRSPAGKARN
ncbi:dynamin family protein [Corynebacterium sp. A21]|uniref:dynamin family protein n=1 Tax=Corynebacterium sp. A21 TaxID=3457318 RepID=UPI003FD5E1F9